MSESFYRLVARQILLAYYCWFAVERHKSPDITSCVVRAGGTNSTVGDAGSRGDLGDSEGVHDGRSSQWTDWTAGEDCAWQLHVQWSQVHWITHVSPSVLTELVVHHSRMTEYGQSGFTVSGWRCGTHCHCCHISLAQYTSAMSTRPDTMADMVIAKCVPKQVDECLVPFLGLVWCTHPIVLWMTSSLTVIMW